MRLGRRFGRFMGDFQSQDRSNLGPKKVPSWSQSGVKIDEKIDQKIDGFENQFLNGFFKDLGKDFGTKIEVEIDVIFERRFFEKTSFSHRKIHVFDINGVQVGSKNRTKTDLKNEVKIGTPPRLHFLWNWVDLGSQVGPKLGGKIKPRQAKTKEDKGSEGKGRERKRKGRDWKGKMWKSVDGEFLRGGGVYPTFRGRLHWFIPP